MIDELEGEILKIIRKAIEMMPDAVIKKALEDTIVQGLMKTAGGLAQIATGCELCTTVVGTIQGIPMIVFGTNTAVEGISELWYISKGEFDQEGKNLIKEATGHKADNIVELAELGVAIWSGRVASKRAASKAAGRIAGEAEKVSEGLQKLRGFRKAKFKTQRLVKKFLPKKRYRKMAVVDVEELAKKQGLKPNLQLFADKVIKKAKAYAEYEWYENVADTTQKASRVKNKIHPHPNAKCDHVVYKTDPTTGKITNYRVYKVNSKNPTGFDEIIGYDGVGRVHKNKVTNEELMPHIHDDKISGQLRKPNIDEIP